MRESVWAAVLLQSKPFSSDIDTLLSPSPPLFVTVILKTAESPLSTVWVSFPVFPSRSSALASTLSIVIAGVGLVTVTVLWQLLFVIVSFTKQVGVNVPGSVYVQVPENCSVPIPLPFPVISVPFPQSILKVFALYPSHVTSEVTGLIPERGVTVRD